MEETGYQADLQMDIHDPCDLVDPEIENDGRLVGNWEAAAGR